MADVERVAPRLRVSPEFACRSRIHRPDIVRRRNIDDAVTSIGVALICCGRPGTPDPGQLTDVGRSNLGEPRCDAFRCSRRGTWASCPPAASAAAGLTPCERTIAASSNDESESKNTHLKLLSQRLQVCAHVVHVGVRVLPELFKVRGQWIIDCKFHLVHRPCAGIPAGSVIEMENSSRETRRPATVSPEGVVTVTFAGAGAGRPPVG